MREEKLKLQGKDIIGNLFLQNKVISKNLKQKPTPGVRISRNNPLAQLKELEKIKKELNENKEASNVVFDSRRGSEMSL